MNPFNAAEAFLWNGLGDHTERAEDHHIFICHAIVEAENRKLITEVDRRTAVVMVMRRLGKHHTVGAYVAYELKIPADDRIYPNLQFYRLRWLNELQVLWARGLRV